MVEQSNTLSNPYTSSNTIDSTGTDTASENKQNRILNKLESTVDTFRKGHMSKTNTITTILAILGKDSNVLLTQSQKEATFDSYLTKIISIQPTLDNSRELDPSNAWITCSSTSFIETSTKRNPKNPHNDTKPQSDDDDDKPSKNQRLWETDIPWFSQSDNSIFTYCNPSCKETCQLLRSYNHNISKAQFFVKIAPNSPTVIPSSQWEHIFKGDAVDLNQIFASLHHAIPDEERTGRLGDTEIVFGVSESKKRVTTASKWSSAWRRASRAISFAFPHQKKELIEYGDYIESKFAAKLTTSHHKIILYDIALRNEVAEGQHFLLTDFHKFTRLYSTIILPDGVKSNSKQPNFKKPSSIQTNNKPEICNKFNIGTCKNSDADYKYWHICKNCKKSSIPKRTVPLVPYEIHGLQPEYLCHNLWKDTLSLSPTTAEWSETAHPLPHPPLKEISNPIALKTITDNPSLFQVKTPIIIDIF
jgi:hypothetical protein